MRDLANFQSQYVKAVYASFKIIVGCNYVKAFKFQQMAVPETEWKKVCTVLSLPTSYSLDVIGF